MWFSNVANCGENEAYPTAYVIIYCFCLPTGLCMYICKNIYIYIYIYVRGGNGSFIFTLLCGVFVLRHSIEMVAFNKVERNLYSCATSVSQASWGLCLFATFGCSLCGCLYTGLLFLRLLVLTLVCVTPRALWVCTPFYCWGSSACYALAHLGSYPCVARGSV